MRQPARDAPERMPLPDFLAWEEAQPLRHERVGGRVWAMTGGTLAHNRIGLNVFSALRTRLASTGCEAFAFDVRVVTPRGMSCTPMLSSLVGNAETPTRN